MANTYTQIYIHFVFVVQGRKNSISRSCSEELHMYITGIVQNKGHKMLAIYAMPDHIHIFIGKKPIISESDLVRDIKVASTKFLKEKKLVSNNFRWQDGFGAFSYANSQIGNVVNYILNQEKHHKKSTFKEEYIEILDQFEIDYKNEYLFKWDED